tara:strand:+ start:396 stop:1037 length:642 start_codon:yes stop_codon:yes gene_type:complete
MKKSQLIKLIKEEITKLANPKKADLNKDGKLSSYEKARGAAIEKNLKEQGGGIRVRLRTCQGALQQYKCVPQGTQLGDRFTANMGLNNSPRQGYVKVFLGGTCTGINVTAPQGGCPNCANENPQQFSCAAQSTGGCPGWSGYNNWENNFTSLPNFSSSNPNQPCQFLCQRNTQWTSQISNVGPQWAAQLQCKLDKVQQLMQTHNCANSNAPAC